MGFTNLHTLARALNRAVELNNGSSHQQILYDAQGAKLAYMSAQTVQKYMLPLANGVQAVFNSSGISYYRHADWLGSSRLALYTTGAVYADQAYAPFGETYAETSTTDRSFTGQTQDTTAGSQGVYDFLLRQQSAAQGRWLVPDPAGLAAVDISNPQTLNRYAYVGNNPLSNVDPLGLRTVCSGPPDDRTCWEEPDPPTFGDIWGGIRQAIAGLLAWEHQIEPPDRYAYHDTTGTKTTTPSGTCVLPSTLKADSTGVLSSAYALTRIASKSGVTVGVGIGGGFGGGIWPFSPIVGAQGSGSALIVTDRLGNSAFVISGQASVAAFSKMKGWYEASGAANFGAQVFLSLNTVDQLRGYSVAASGSAGNIGVDVGTSGISLTVGAGVGARIGGGLGAGGSVVIPICHE